MSVSNINIFNKNLDIKPSFKLIVFQRNKWKMGESESKFRPDPQDVWYKVRATGKQPRLLQSVMQAIVDLREYGGSTHCRIFDYLQGVINCMDIRPRPRGLSQQVKKALFHGIENGLLKQKSGKFSLALNPKDFAIFKSFRAFDPIFGETRIKKKRRNTKSGCKTEKKSRTSTRKSKSTAPNEGSDASDVSTLIDILADDKAELLESTGNVENYCESKMDV